MLASDGGSAEVIHALIVAMATTGISGVGLIRAMRPGGGAPLKLGSVQHGSDHAACLLQRNSVLVFHMAWRVTGTPMRREGPGLPLVPLNGILEG